MKKTLILTPLVMLLLLTSNFVLAKGTNITSVKNALTKCAMSSDSEVEDGGSTCCSKSVGVCVFCDEGNCHTVPYFPAGKMRDKNSLRPSAPITSGTLAPVITEPTTPIKPSVIAPSNKVLVQPLITVPTKKKVGLRNRAIIKPSIIAPSNKVITKPSVIAPSNRTIKKTTRRSISSAVGTSADREASKPSISNLK